MSLVMEAVTKDYPGGVRALDGVSLVIGAPAPHIEDIVGTAFRRRQRLRDRHALPLTPTGS